MLKIVPKEFRGIEWKTGRKPKMGKAGRKKKKAHHSPKWGKDGPTNGEKKEKMANQI